MTDKKKLQIFFFFILSGGVFILLFFMFRPFLQTISLAAIFAIFFYPFYRKVLPFCFQKEGIAASIVISIALIFIAIPLYLLGIQVFDEARSFYFSISADNAGFIQEATALIESPVKHFYPGFIFDLRAYAEYFADFLLRSSASFISGTALILLETILFFLSFFFFLKDGKLFTDGFMAISPLTEKTNKELLFVLKGSINATVRGSLFIAIIQGILVGIGLYFFNVPNPILWGAIAAIASLIPTIGTGLVNLPAILYLVYANDYAAATGLMIWSIFLVGTIDNILAPLFYKKSGVKAHELLILFSILGGLSYFGPAGFLFGPIILSLFISLFHIYKVLLLEGREQ